jgi:uncharacterized protein YdcH (DUF465 family)
MPFRKRPSNDYLLQADWESIHALCLHWQSDMDFFKDELRFFETLIEKYFIWLNKEEKVRAVELLNAKIKKFAKESNQLSEQINEHLRHLEHFIANKPSETADEFRQEHVKLEDSLVAFIQQHTQVKKEVFEVTERAVDEDLLNNSDFNVVPLSTE